MALLVNNASGTTANTAGAAVPFTNKDPVFVGQSLLNTVYFWATVWGGASVQLYVCPQINLSLYQPVWIPLGPPITENTAYNFQQRWGNIKAEVTGATTSTSDLYTDLFTGAW